MDTVFIQGFCADYVNKLDLTDKTAFARALRVKLMEPGCDPNVTEWITCRLLEVGPWPDWFKSGMNYNTIIESHAMDPAIERFVTYYNKHHKTDTK
jgi:hypothetical protein